MKQILVIGEKTSQVKAFATALCGNYTSNKESKYLYTYSGTWAGMHLTFLPLAGHIGQLDTAQGYGWGEIAPIKLVYEPQAIIMKNQSKYVRVLRKYIKGKDGLWLATDPDAEGSNIAWEVMNILNSQIKRNGIVVKRIWNSSLTSQEIIRAFSQPQSWTDFLALGVQGRRLIDAWLGFAGTRELTRAARQVSKVKVISVGRVQLPCLLLIVKQDLRHELFTKQDRWKLVGMFSTSSGESYHGDYSTGFFYEKQQLQTVIQDLTNHHTGEISSSIKSIKNTAPPYPLNTTSAISLLSKLMKVSAAKALALMVNLYEEALLSYPRTENKKFKNGFPHKAILSNLLQIATYQPYITQIKNTTQVRSNGPKKEEQEDHDPIHPTGDLSNYHKLNPQQKQAYDILTRYYISLFMDDLIVSSQSVNTKVGSHQFLTEGRNIVQIGWRAITPWIKTKTADIPDLPEGMQVDYNGNKTETSETQPPPRLTDSQLILLMEKLHIGTKSSRPDIISKLVARNYVLRKKQQLISTQWGRSLIASLSPIWPDIVTPKFTSHVEDLMDQVATQKKPYQQMVEQLREEYLDLHKDLVIRLQDYKKLLLQLNLSDQRTKVRTEDMDLVNHILKQRLAGSDDTIDQLLTGFDDTN